VKLLPYLTKEIHYLPLIKVNERHREEVAREEARIVKRMNPDKMYNKQAGRLFLEGEELIHGRYGAAPIIAAARKQSEEFRAQSVIQRDLRREDNEARKLAKRTGQTTSSVAGTGRERNAMSAGVRSSSVTVSADTSVGGSSSSVAGTGRERNTMSAGVRSSSATGSIGLARLRIEQGSIYSRGARVGSMLACDDDRKVLAVIVTGSDADGAGVIISRYQTPAMGRLAGKLNPNANWSDSDSSDEDSIEYESAIEFHDVDPSRACLGFTYHEGNTAKNGIGYTVNQLELIPTREAEVQVNAEGALIWPSLPEANKYLQQYYCGMVAQQLKREFAPSVCSELALDVAKQAVGYISLVK